jgi:predicted nucleotidyltransferase component of viral defense system
MKEHLRDLVAGAATPTLALCLAREYLQARILQSLQAAGAFTRWAFLGGTALRFLYRLPRFSEDLDFSTIAAGRDPGFRGAIAEVARALTAERYAVDVRVSDARAVASAMVRFPGLPHELGLSPHTSQTLTVKVEVDTRPPAGAEIETTLVRRHVTMHLCHHDRASLLAGKLHAVLSRPWTKGRDLYDLGWYLADPTWPEPNLTLLNNALAQTGRQGEPLTRTTWRAAVRERFQNADWDRARADVLPFLEREQDVALVDREVLLKLLR